MKPRGRLAAAWAAAGLVALGCVGVWSVAVPTVSPERVTPRGAVPKLQQKPLADPAKAAATIRQHDPFRLDRRPTAVRYNPWEPAAPIIAAPRPTRPLLGVVGIVGPPWNALVQGIPGRESGALLAVGDSTNGIKIARITRDTVYLVGLDTTWALTPRRSWQ